MFCHVILYGSSLLSIPLFSRGGHGISSAVAGSISSLCDVVLALMRVCACVRVCVYVCVVSKTPVLVCLFMPCVLKNFHLRLDHGAKNQHGISIANSIGDPAAGDFFFVVRLPLPAAAPAIWLI